MGNATYFSVTLNAQKPYLYGGKRLNNVSALLTITPLASVQKSINIHLWLRIAWMNCKLKKLAKFFKFLLSILEKLLKTDYSLFLLL